MIYLIGISMKDVTGNLDSSLGTPWQAKARRTADLLSVAISQELRLRCVKDAHMSPAIQSFTIFSIACVLLISPAAGQFLLQSPNLVDGGSQDVIFPSDSSSTAVRIIDLYKFCHIIFNTV